MAYPKQTWDTSSYVNPTRMNHIEDGIKSTVDGLTNIYIEGSTNNTGSTIASGKYFYLNGTLVKAKTDIANGATFTLNTNYEVVTAGALNELVSELKTANTIKLNTRDSSGITLTCNYVEFEKIVIVYAVLNLYVSVDNATQLTTNTLPLATGTPILQEYSSSYAMGSVRISNGHMYLNQTLPSGTYYICGCYIKA